MNASTVVMALDETGRIAAAAPDAEALLGYSGPELVGSQLRSLLPDLPDPLPREGADQQPLACRRKDGTQFTAGLRLSPMDTATGRLVAVSLWDAANPDHPHTRDLLAAIVESSRDAIIGASLDGVITSWNQAAQRILGYTSQETLGRPVTMLLPAERRGREQEILRQAGQGRRVELDQEQCLYKDGSRLAVAATVSPIADAGGAIVGVSTLIRPLSEQDRARDVLIGLVDGLPLAIVATDQRGAIIAVNTAAETLFDYPRMQLIGQPIEILVPDRLREVHAAHRLDYQATPRRRPYANHLRLAARRRSGQQFTASISLTPLDIGGEHIVAATVVDISEQERYETQRAEVSRQLERTRRWESVGQLAGGIAHDFNNILAVITSRCELLQDALSEMSPDPQEPHWRQLRTDVARISAAAMRGSALTRQLLTFGRRDVATPEPINLDLLIRQILDLLTSTVGSGIRVVTELTEQTWPVLADPGRLEQVIANLASNARDAMPHGGTLTLSATNQTLTYPDHGLPAGDYVRLQVADTGSGMAPDVAERAFEPFFTTKSSTTGTGLGLASVHTIITQAAGSVTFATEPGVGTTFTILLPALTIAPQPPAPQPATPGASAVRVPSPADTGSPTASTILVVDDEPDLAEAHQHLLRRAGYTVLSATDPHTGLRIAQQAERIDLLLTDVTMPDINGADLARRVRAHHPGAKVVFISGHAAAHLGTGGLLETGATLLTKPCDRTTLLTTVTQLLTAEPETHPPADPR